MNARLEKELEHVGDACRNAGLVRAEFAAGLLEELEVASAKLSERKTIHEWLDTKGEPREENGKPLCLLRRLAIALEIHDKETEEERLMNMEEYNEGISEYQAGYLRTSNSHTLGSDEWKAWDAGWVAAENAEP